MNSTSASLLQRLQQPNEQAAWQRFVDLYAPLIFHWARNHGLTATDAADLTQDVLAALVDKLPQFQYDPTLRFRGWLRTLTQNRANDFHRRRASQPARTQEVALEDIAVTTGGDLFEQTEYRRFVVRRAMELMQAEFSEAHWQACCQHFTLGTTLAELARQQGVSANSLRVAKYRVLKRLREELQDLLE